MGVLDTGFHFDRTGRAGLCPLLLWANFEEMESTGKDVLIHAERHAKSYSLQNERNRHGQKVIYKILSA